ncbi:MAG: ferredoxin family protein [Chloroflexi bacterium]|nr:ferredoxin family protein [Chloroflexota bacterium]MCH8008358.1 ferredoxin family protein [Chloroflexota bacterium]
MTYVITEPCIDLKDATCVDVCPVDCIHTTDDDNQFYIDPEICIDCEACVFVCPVDAIFYEEDVPEKWKKFTKINLDYFSAKTDEERRTFRTRTERI